MQSATASGTCPDILNSHSHLLTKDALLLLLNRFAPKTLAVAWSQIVLRVWSQPHPVLVHEGLSAHSSFILVLCGGRETQFVLVLQRAFVFQLLPEPSLSPGKSVCMMQN